MGNVFERALAGEQSAQLTLCRVTFWAIVALGLAMLGVCVVVQIVRLAA
jgi:hypothetical protein